MNSLIKCIIVEDQVPAQRILIKYIEDSGILLLDQVFSDPLSALLYLKTNKVDLIFLDVDLPKLSGIDFLNLINQKAFIIITTAFPEFALKGFDLDVTDYLLKPFPFDRFMKAIGKVHYAVQLPDIKDKQSSLPQFIKVGHEFFQLDILDIIHIQSDADYTELVFEQKKILSNEPLKFWSNVLANHGFYQIHKSHIVNIKKVKKANGFQVILTTGQVLPIGRLYKSNFFKVFLK